MELKAKILMVMCWMLFILLLEAESFLHVYHTNRNHLVGKYDCFVYFDKSMALMNMEFCRRPIDSWHFVQNSREEHCLQDKQTFDKMRVNGIDSVDLLMSFAPIDVIDRYQAFLENPLGVITNEREVENNYFCNCSDARLQAFGRNCEYRFEITVTKNVRNILSQISSWFRIIIETQKSLMLGTRSKKYLVTSGTCYLGLPECLYIHRNVCLQWDQICDGQIDCVDGVDEKKCLALEMQQCDPINEYRCRQGLCIPRLAAFDGVYDCGDLSDDTFHPFPAGTDYSPKIEICRGWLHPLCYNHVCGWGWFSCGDGQCTNSLWTRPVCDNRRDIALVRDVLSMSSNSSSDFCWEFAICQLGFNQFFRELDWSNCMTKFKCNQSEFIFPFEHPIAHPSIRLVYSTNKRSFEERVTPEYICYDAVACLGIYQPTIMKLNHTCNEWEEIMNHSYYAKQNWTSLVYDLHQTFGACVLPRSSSSENDSDALYDCGSVLISKHRLKDGFADCSNGADESSTHNTCALSMTERFQCTSNSSECVRRVQVADGRSDCSDGSDENKFYLCFLSGDFGCRWRRGSLDAIVPFNFREVCDGFIDIKLDNDTDESECPSTWIHSCNTSILRCDHYWHCRDGHDELGCYTNNTQYPYYSLCMGKQQFHCMNRTSGQFQCFPSELAGDGLEHCVGAVDERVQGYCQLKYPLEKSRRFRCGGNSNVCIDRNLLCDGVADCEQVVNSSDDEVVCPERKAYTNYREFVCENGTVINDRQRCDSVPDCKNGEDEYYCFISDPIVPYIQMNPLFSQLEDIIVYPPTADQNVHHRENTRHIQTLSKQMTENDGITLIQGVNVINNDRYNQSVSWYCNGGFLVRHSKSYTTCLCAFGHYGERCEYQRRRVSVTIQLDASDQYSDKVITIKLVIYLMSVTEDGHQVIDVEQKVFLPRHKRESSLYLVVERYLVILLFPIMSNHSTYLQNYVKIDGYIVTNQSLDFQASWYYDLPFVFLPVQALVVQVVLLSKTNAIGYCAHGHHMTYHNALQKTWCQCDPGWMGADCDRPDSLCQSDTCSSGSICVPIPLRNSTYCLCTLSRTGPSCRVPDIVCSIVTCKHNGTCVPMSDLEYGFYCACPNGFTGKTCEQRAVHVNIRFDRELAMKYSNVPAITVFFNYVLEHLKRGSMEESYKRLFRHVQLTHPLPTIFLNRETQPYDFGFVQFFVSPFDKFGQYYLIISNNTDNYNVPSSQRALYLETTVIPRNKCPFIEQIFNTTVLSLRTLQRVKFYQEPCRQIPHLACFHDESYMCLCNRHQITQCFMFFQHATNCVRSHLCLNDGLCLQENELQNPLDFFCVCKECYFGNLCQFTTSQYSISLDALIGQSIRTDLSWRQQPIVIQLCLAGVGIIFFLGLGLNTLTIILFTLQHKCRETGSGLYILTSSILGICSLIMLSIKFISLILVPQLSGQMGCIFIEYFLKYLPTVVDWINASVALERVWTVRVGIGFDMARSKRWAKKSILLLLLLIASSLMHDPWYRRSIVDPRLNEGYRPWCVVQFESKMARSYNTTINLLHYIIPFLTNLSCISIILYTLARTKSKAKKQNFRHLLKEQMLANKHWIISPIVLVTFALPRLIFALIFTCISTSTPWQNYMLLAGYFVAFLPQVAPFVIFVLPSEFYTKELAVMSNRVRRRCCIH